MRLVAENLTCIRGTRPVFTQLSFSLAKNECLLLKGPNGSGKTSLLRALAGFLPLAAGEVRLEEADANAELQENCHYVGHLNGVKSALTVAENLRFYCHYLGGAGIEEALQAFNLEPIRQIPAGLLSAGQKRRVGLARLLVAQRPIWFLDEPSVSLDSASVELLAKQVNNHVETGGIVIAATHIPLGLEFAKTLDMADIGNQKNRASEREL